MTVGLNIVVWEATPIKPGLLRLNVSAEHVNSDDNSLQHYEIVVSEDDFTEKTSTPDIVDVDLELLKNYVNKQITLMRNTSELAKLITNTTIAWAIDLKEQTSTGETIPGMQKAYGETT